MPKVPCNPGNALQEQRKIREQRQSTATQKMYLARMIENIPNKSCDVAPVHFFVFAARVPRPSFPAYGIRKGKSRGEHNRSSLFNLLFGGHCPAYTLSFSMLPCCSMACHAAHV